MAIGPDIDLNIGTDTLRLISEKARTVGAGIDEDYEDGHEHEVEFDAATLSDRHAHDGLAEEEEEDAGEAELTEMISELNVDEARELVAIVWIGRGDFAASDWLTALEQAHERAQGPTARYLLGMPLLADYIDAGMDTLGL